MITEITDVTELAQVAGGITLADFRARFEGRLGGTAVPDSMTGSDTFGSGSAIGDVTSIDFSSRRDGNRTSIIGVVTATSS